MTETSPCPNCGSDKLYEHDGVYANGGGGPHLLPDLGGFFRFAKFAIVVCEDCGLTSFFAAPEARAKLATSLKWKRL